MDNNHKMNEEELSQVAGGIPMNYNGTRYCINCGKEYYEPWGMKFREHMSTGMCNDCNSSSNFKRGFRRLRYMVFGHDYNKDKKSKNK